MSQERCLIVDGHSIIHAWPDLRALHQGPERRRARQELVRVLEVYADAVGQHVVVVFDGTQAKTQADEQADRIQVFYSAAHRTADDVIERLVGKYAAEMEISVASDDGMVRQTVSALDAFWLSSGGLQTEIDRAERVLRDRLDRLRRS
ncbi:MAG: NYN domain-containing protein [Verrucomicrobiota bacterium]